MATTLLQAFLLPKQKQPQCRVPGAFSPEEGTYQNAESIHRLLSVHRSQSTFLRPLRDEEYAQARLTPASMEKFAIILKILDAARRFRAE